MIIYVPIGGGGGGGGAGGSGSGGGGSGRDDDDNDADGGESSERSSGSGVGAGLGLRNRLARARNVAAHVERLGSGGGPATATSSSTSITLAANNSTDGAESVASGTASVGTDGGGGGGDDDAAKASASAMSDPAAAAAPPPGPIVHSSKHEKDLHKKFCTDFPNGRTVILSTLLESSQSAMAACSPLKNQEWKTLLQALGSAIVAGFKERVARYDEELRRLNTMRAEASSPKAGGSSSSSRASLAGDTTFDLARFFLIKESLAFTYEQMQLPAEALLQYEELGAIVPEGRWTPPDSDPTSQQADGGGEESDSATTSSDVDSIGFADLAKSGNAAGFRRRIRRTKDELTPAMAHLTHQYLHAREIQLLFKMGDPVEVIRRTHRNISHHYRMMLERFAAPLDGANASADEAAKVVKARAEAEAWTLASCWDVKCAAEGYFSFVIDADVMGDSSLCYSSAELDASYAGDIIPTNTAEGSAEPQSGGLSDGARDPCQAEEESGVACQLGDLLSFARLRLLRLGDLELDGSNPIRDANVERPKDMSEPWIGWADLPRVGRSPSRQRSEGSIDVPLSSNLPSPSSQAFDGALQETKSCISSRYCSPWLRGAFASAESYTKKYLELSSAIIALNENSGRFRFAARLLGERAEIFILQKDYEMAAQLLISIVDVFAHDQWDGAYYWLVGCECMPSHIVHYHPLSISHTPPLSLLVPPGAFSDWPLANA